MQKNLVIITCCSLADVHISRIDSKFDPCKEAGTCYAKEEAGHWRRDMCIFRAGAAPRNFVSLLTHSYAVGMSGLLTARDLPDIARRQAGSWYARGDGAEWLQVSIGLGSILTMGSAKGLASRMGLFNAEDDVDVEVELTKIILRGALDVGWYSAKDFSKEALELVAGRQSLLRNAAASSLFILAMAADVAAGLLERNERPY